MYPKLWGAVGIEYSELRTNFYRAYGKESKIMDNKCIGVFIQDLEDYRQSR